MSKFIFWLCLIISPTAILCCLLLIYASVAASDVISTLFWTFMLACNSYSLNNVIKNVESKGIS